MPQPDRLVRAISEAIRRLLSGTREPGGPAEPALSSGPFDLIGDVHGCADELEALLERLGYGWTERLAAGGVGSAGEPDADPSGVATGSTDEPGFTYRRVYRHPAGRVAVFVGDLVDRGPRSLDACQLVMGMVEAGHALSVPGNHDDKFLRKLKGNQVRVAYGLQLTLEELKALSEADRQALTARLIAFFESLPSHLVLDHGALVVAHAGMSEALQGSSSRRARDFALYGMPTGEVDSRGLPIRYDWAADYRGAARVVYGHTVVGTPRWVNGTMNIDTGCAFGGHLTALRYPELEVVSVPAFQRYAR